MTTPRPVPRFAWSPVPRPGCRGVEGRVLLWRPSLVLAMLRFEPGATIDEHSASVDIDVICIEGSGYVSVDGDESPIAAGASIHWPAGLRHRLWTGDRAMMTLMVEQGGDTPTAPIAAG